MLTCDRAVNDRVRESLCSSNRSARRRDDHLVSDLRPEDTFARNILDCAEPNDPAVRQAIDDKLGCGSTDPVLHAAALWVAFSAGADLRLSRSYARGWIPGLHELIQSGHLDAAFYALPRLTAVFPHRPALEYMASIFQQMPAAASNGRDPFVDDRSSDAQIVITPGADTVVIAFCGARHQLGLSINLLDRWFAHMGSHLIYLRDRQKIGYTGGIAALGSDMATTINSLKKRVREMGARRVVCLGTSAGASGALRYARPLGAERVLALAPITGGPEYAKKVAPQFPPGGVMPWGDLVPLYRDNDAVRVRILYGEKNAGDRQQCIRMAGLPGVRVEALADWESHYLVGGLLRAGRLKQVLGWLMCDEEREEPLYALGSEEAPTLAASSSRRNKQNYRPSTPRWTPL